MLSKNDSQIISIFSVEYGRKCTRAKRIEMLSIWLERSQLLILFIHLWTSIVVHTDFFEFSFFSLLLSSLSSSSHLCAVVVVNFARLLDEKGAQMRCTIINTNNIFFLNISIAVHCAWEWTRKIRISNNNAFGIWQKIWRTEIQKNFFHILKDDCRMGEWRKPRIWYQDPNLFPLQICSAFRISKKRKI